MKKTKPGSWKKVIVWPLFGINENTLSRRATSAGHNECLSAILKALIGMGMAAETAGPSGIGGTALQNIFWIAGWE